MLARALNGVRKLGFFWGKKKKTQMQQLAEYCATPSNIEANIKKLFQQNKGKPLLLPPKTDNKLTIVMELDEVLMYSFTPNQQGYLQAPYRKYDYYEQMLDQNLFLSIYKRKNLQNFINYVTEEHQAVLWTQSQKQYVQLMLTKIDPEKKIKHVFTQQYCNQYVDQQQSLDQFMKDLNMLGRDLSRVLYFDHKPQSYFAFPDNVIPMQQFVADNTMVNQDLNLYILQLQHMKNFQDIRVYLRQKYHLSQFLKKINVLK